MGGPPSRRISNPVRVPGSRRTPVAAYPSQPAAPFSPAVVAPTTAASSPMPAIAAKVTPSATARSIRRSCGPEPTVSAAPSDDGMPSAVASRFAVPRGTIASGTSVPARACAQARTVPSPPTANTSRAPAATASRVTSWPASADRVSSSSSFQPHAAAAATDLCCRCGTCRIRFRLTISAAISVTGPGHLCSAQRRSDRQRDGSAPRPRDHGPRPGAGPLPEIARRATFVPRHETFCLIF